MTRRAPLDCDVAPRHQPAGHARACAIDGCANAGEYRAPKDRNLQEYLLLCLEHVRAYNAKWDFHKGLSAAEVEQEIRRASTWERPTWKLGTLGAGLRPERMHVHDPFGFTHDMQYTRQRDKKRARGETAQERAVITARDNALHVLDLTAPVTLEALKRRYKVLVKQYHPDANGGSHQAEDQMKVINEAYQTLKAALAPVI